VARGVERVRGNDVKDDIAKVRGQRDDIEEDVADGQEFQTHGCFLAMRHPFFSGQTEAAPGTQLRIII
jgi:hypothetical protein